MLGYLVSGSIVPPPAGTRQVRSVPLRVELKMMNFASAVHIGTPGSPFILPSTVSRVGVPPASGTVYRSAPAELSLINATVCPSGERTPPPSPKPSPFDSATRQRFAPVSIENTTMLTGPSGIHLSASSRNLSSEVQLKGGTYPYGQATSVIRCCGPPRADTV